MAVARTEEIKRKMRQVLKNLSAPKNTKSEVEISPDNEVLDLLSEETPPAPEACQGETNESLTSLDRIPTSSGSEALPQTVLNICCERCQPLKKPPVISDLIVNSPDPKVLNQGKGLMLPEPDMLQRYLQQKSAEINVLLQNIQSLITYQKSVSPQKVKPQQSLFSQMERRQLPVKQQWSAKKTP